MCRLRISLEACNCIVKKRVGGHLLSATSNLSVSGPSSPGVQGADFSLKRPFWHGDIAKVGGTLYFSPSSEVRYVVNMPSEELKERNKRAF